MVGVFWGDGVVKKVETSGFVWYFGSLGGYGYGYGFGC